MTHDDGEPLPDKRRCSRTVDEVNLIYAADTTCHLYKLPNETICLILDHFNYEELQRIRLASKRLLEICNERLASGFKKLEGYIKYDIEKCTTRIMENHQNDAVRICIGRDLMELVHGIVNMLDFTSRAEYSFISVIIWRFVHNANAYFKMNMFGGRLIDVIINFILVHPENRRYSHVRVIRQTARQFEDHFILLVGKRAGFTWTAVGSLIVDLLDFSEALTSDRIEQSDLTKGTYELTTSYKLSKTWFCSVERDETPRRYQQRFRYICQCVRRLVSKTVSFNCRERLMRRQTNLFGSPLFASIKQSYSGVLRMDSVCFGAYNNEAYKAEVEWNEFPELSPTPSSEDVVQEVGADEQEEFLGFPEVEEEDVEEEEGDFATSEEYQQCKSCVEITVELSCPIEVGPKKIIEELQNNCSSYYNFKSLTELKASGGFALGLNIKCQASQLAELPHNYVWEATFLAGEA